ncbi:hypothetical protein VCHA51O444_80056 [Vibrio chagasii]|nr:hypothetical protein VCHA53O473_80037 [Vibrio chagasii]CAH7460944.1 hypothetical protein VCHA51O444_80056 [Vibrio chagasii]
MKARAYPASELYSNKNNKRGTSTIQKQFYKLIIIPIQFN